LASLTKSLDGGFRQQPPILVIHDALELSKAEKALMMPDEEALEGARKKSNKKGHQRTGRRLFSLLRQKSRKRHFHSEYAGRRSSKWLSGSGSWDGAW